MKIKCSTCGKIWSGSNEYEIEIKIEQNPCKCKEEAEKMSMEELLERINKNKKEKK